jgi:hypothetical protein
VLLALPNTPDAQAPGNSVIIAWAAATGHHKITGDAAVTT